MNFIANACQVLKVTGWIPLMHRVYHTITTMAIAIVTTQNDCMSCWVQCLFLRSIRIPFRLNVHAFCRLIGSSVYRCVTTIKVAPASSECIHFVVLHVDAVVRESGKVPMP